MKMLVGLGNPGPKYQMTRHNIGFMLIDAIAHESSGDYRSEHNALTKKVVFGGDSILLVKPQTFMNLSGEAVRAIKEYYKFELPDLLVVHDEVDLPFASMRFQIRRGHGGNNGVRNIHQMLGTDDYARLKLGVGRPHHEGQDVSQHVLENFSKQEFSELPDFISRAIEACEYFVSHGLERAANEFNAKEGQH